MIVVRRILAIPLVLVFFVLIVAALLVTQANDTAANPDFYSDRLREADAYNFVYDELLPTALDEAEADGSLDPPIDFSAIEDDLVSAARSILPPEWLQLQAETVFNTAIPYLVNDSDSFVYTVQLKDRAEAAAEAVKTDILGGEAFASLYGDGISHLADELLENLDKLPYSLDLDRTEIEEALTEVIPRDWVATQAEEAVDAVTPYLTGDSDHFTIVVQLGDLVDTVAAAAVDLLGQEETYDYLLDEIVTPAIEGNLGLTVDLGYGISLTSDEIKAAVKQTLPYAWAHDRLIETIDGIASYVKGQADSIDLTIDLNDRKEVALELLVQLADEKLEALFDSLPQCTLSEFMAYQATLPPNTLPDCRPMWVSYEQAKLFLGVDIGSLVDELVGDRIPDQWVFTDADLRETMGAYDGDFLEEARNHVVGGWTYTDSDLRNDLGSDDSETLEDVRGWVGSGYTITETDLRDAMGDEGLDSLDSLRSWTSGARTWLWALWLVPFLVLLCIGLLGGRTWRSRLLWMAAVLFFTSLAAFAVTAISYSISGEPAIGEAIDLAQYDGVGLVVAEKSKEIALDAGGAYTSGVETKAIYMIVSSVAVMAGVLGWAILERRREKEPAETST